MKQVTSSSSRFAVGRALLGFVVLSGLGLFSAGCYSKAESHAFTGIAGDRIGDDYVYYPAYEVYYSPAKRDYVYYNGQAWVRETTPRQAWVGDVANSPSVRMDFHDSPEHHHTEIVKRYPHSWTAETVPGTPARTTNDDVAAGTRSPDDKGNH